MRSLKFISRVLILAPLFVLFLVPANSSRGNAQARIIAAARSTPGVSQCIALNKLPGFPQDEIIDVTSTGYRVDFVNREKCSQGNNCSTPIRKYIACVLMDLNLDANAVICTN